MIEITEVAGKLTAVVDECVLDSDGIMDVEVLWLKPNAIASEAPVQLPNLSHLRVDSVSQSITEIVSPKSLLQCEIMVFSRAESSSRGLIQLSVSHRLRRLTLRDQLIGQDTKSWIGQQPNLKNLDVAKSDFGDSDLQQLTCWNSLESLNVSDTSCNMLDVHRGPALAVLDVSGTCIAIDSLERINRSFPGLERLVAQGTNLDFSSTDCVLPEHLRGLYTGNPAVDFDDGERFWT